MKNHHKLFHLTLTKTNTKSTATINHLTVINNNKIPTTYQIVSSTQHSIINNNIYALSTINKNSNKYNSKQFDDVINSENNNNNNKGSFLNNNQKVDQLTNEKLLEYQTKLKQIRTYHNLMTKEIQQKYKAMMGKLQAQLLMKPNNNQQQQSKQVIQQQLQQLQASRMSQLLKNQQKQKSKLQFLQQQYSHQIKKSRKQYQLEYIKKYMLENVDQFKDKNINNKSNGQYLGTDDDYGNNKGKPTLLQQLIAQTTGKKQQLSSYIPNNLVLKKLYFTHDNNKQSAVLLAGVEENDEDHCAYLKTLIQRLKVKNVLSMLPPDMPYFIKTQSSFLSQWREFLKIPSPTVKFYLNPNPKTLNDITLASTHIPLVLHGMTKSKSFYQTTFSLMQMNESNMKYEHQPLFSGLMSGLVQNVYFCDYPFLKGRQMIAMNVGLEDLRQLIKRYAYYKQNERQHFSAQLLLPKTVVQKKYRHIIKLAKTIALTKQSTPILLCPASIAQVLAQQWQKSPQQYLQFDYTQNSYLLDMQLNKQGQKQTLFIQFIEKLVILDIILQPLIQKYFVKYGSFPYSCRNTIGGKENLSKVFLLWSHYYSLYSNSVKGKFTSEKDKWQVPL